MKSNFIFTDGASRGNPGPGGWGAIVVLGEKVHELGGGEKQTTNNRMELLAAIEALHLLSKKLSTNNHQLSATLYTDSSYVLKGATVWIHGWKKNGWKTKAKDDVLNKDLWKKFLNVSEGLKISWKLLLGHSGIPGNERCDEIATSFADGEKIKLYSAPLSKYSVDVSITGNSGSPKNHKLKPKSSAKPYSYVSSVGGVVKTHVTWAECEAQVKGKSGALFKKSLSGQDEKNIIAKWKKSRDS